MLLTWLDLLCLLFLLYADAFEFYSNLLHYGIHSVSVSELFNKYLILVTPFATNKDFYLHYYTHYFLFLFKKNVFFLPERFIDTELDPCALECAVLKCFVIRSLLQSIKWVTYCCYFYSSTFSYFTNNLKGWWQRVMYNITWDSNTYEILWVLQ